MKFCVLYGSVRDTRMGIRLARYMCDQLEDRHHEVQFMDAKELDLPLLNKRYLDYGPGEAPKELERLAHAYREADGFVIVSGEYNYGIQPGLKNMLDYFTKEYFFRPSAMALYSGGDFGGVRAAMSLIPSLWALHMTPIPAHLIVPKIHDKFDAEGKPTDASMNERAARFIHQFEWYARALKAEREKGIPS
jgi:NAD(P)H-dependent FMN reductase